MAKRIAQVDIKIGGIQTIGDLEKKLASMNEQIKKMEIGSKAYKKLAAEIAKANDEQKKLNAELEGVTSTEAAEGALKLGEGIAGAAIAIQGFSTFLGKNNEELQEAIAKVGGLILVLDGFRRATEAVSAENIKRLKGLGRAFTRLGAQMKAAFAANPVVLIAAAILAVSAAVVGLIRNFDRLGAILKNTWDGSRREIRKNIKELEKLKEAQDAIAGSVSAEATARQELVEYTEDYRGAVDAAFKSNIENIKQLETERNLLVQQTRQLFQKIEGMRETRKKYKEIKLEIDANNEAISSLNTQLELERLKLNEVGAQWNSINEIVANKEAQRRLQNMLKILSGREFTAKATYEQGVKNIQLQLQEIELTKQSNGLYRKGQKEQIEALNAELLALNEKERIRKRDLELSIEELTRGKEYQQTVTDITKALEYNDIALQSMADEYQKIVQENEFLLQQQEQYADSQDYILGQIQDRIPLDEKTKQLMEDILGFKYDDLKLSGEIQGIYVEDLKVNERIRLEYQLQVNKLNEMYNAKQNILANEIVFNQKIIEGLDTQIKWTEAVVEAAEARKTELQVEKEKYEAGLANAKNREEEFYWMQRIEKVDAEILGLDGEITSKGNEIVSLLNEREATITEINAIESESVLLSQQKADEEAKITYELEQQNRLSERAKTFLEDYNEEIQASRELIAESFELWATLADRQAEMARRRHEKALEDLEEISDKQKENADEQEDLEDLLKDANGQRYDEILGRMAEIKTENEALGIQEAELNQAAMKAQYEMEIAEWKAEKRRKAAAIIDATIQGALSVIQALPNIILSAIVGGLSIAGIATIAAQPISPKPEKPEGATFAEGGYTGEGGKHEPAGIVHRGEYVVPQDIVSSNTGAEMIGVLEAMRTGLKGYAEGGMVSPATQTETAAQDFSMMAEQIAESLRRNPAVVSVVEITDRQNRVKVIESNASIYKNK